MIARSGERIAVFSTIHPGSVPYVGAWFESLCRQTVREFDLWIALDGVDFESLDVDWSRVGGVLPVEAEENDTPARLRERAWKRITEDYDAIVMVDSDDMLAPTRVAAAGASLAGADVSACALKLTGPEGRPLGRTLPVSSVDTDTETLMRHNVYGLTNTVWRSRTLEACIQQCGDCVLLDWLLATRASLQGWRLGHDPRPHVLYRQHGSNVVPVLPPFSGDQIRGNTRLVLDHLARLRRSADDLTSDQVELVAGQEEWVLGFRDRVCGDEPRMGLYLESLNGTAACLPWHACVAHPDLRSIWS